MNLCTISVHSLVAVVVMVNTSMKPVSTVSISLKHDHKVMS